MRRNNIIIIKVILILCVTVVAVTVQTYNKHSPTPKFRHKEGIQIINEYYSGCRKKNLSHNASIKKTVDWLNGKVPSSPPVPEGIVKACYIIKTCSDKTPDVINITLSDGQQISGHFYFCPPGGFIFK